MSYLTLPWYALRGVSADLGFVEFNWKSIGVSEKHKATPRVFVRSNGLDLRDGLKTVANPKMVRKRRGTRVNPNPENPFILEATRLTRHLHPSRSDLQQQPRRSLHGQ